MPQERPDRLAKAITEFCRFARGNGLSAGVKKTLETLEAARAVPIADREAFRFGLRAALCCSKEEFDLFDSLFEVFWGGTMDHRQPASRKSGGSEPARADGHGEEDGPWAPSVCSAGPALREEGEGKGISGASAHERLKKTDFSKVPQSDLAALQRISRRLLRRMSLRLSRRLRTTNSRGPVDLRRTIRLSIARGGDPIDLSRRGRRIRPAGLVILLDVSGSMNPYSLFLLKFAYALQKHFQRAATFIFNTKLAEITGALRTRQLADALKALSEKAAGWAGGTKIGESLRDFNLFYGAKLLSGSTFFIILSDGWDTGEPEMLAAELRSIKRRVRKLIWLNPLLGLDSYQPITRGMSAALPYVDVFASAHNLESLLELERHFQSRAYRVERKCLTSS